MKKIVLSYILIFLFNYTNAQSCLNINSNPDLDMDCTIACFNVNVQVPDIKSTETYQVIPTPYNPFALTGGTAAFSSYIDDRWTDPPPISIPFTFCFYGQNFNSLVVGSNGVVSFNIALAGGFNNYVVGAGVTIPNATYPSNVIMAPFHDIDPANATTTNPPDRVIEYKTLGVAPCRKFVITFYKIPYYNCDVNPTETNLNTSQIVLHEGTGVIDIFIKDKVIACGASTNAGRAILGIQKNGTTATDVPGRNATVWSAVNEGWRFIPSGTTSLLNRVELQRNGTSIATGILTPNGSGQVDVAFTPQVCQPEDSMQYVVKAFYGRCDNPTIETEATDTIIRYKRITPFTTTTTKTDVLCNGTNTGSITVLTPIGAAYEYSIDGINWQSSPSFTNLPANTYNITARIIASFCANRTTVTITQPTTLTLVAVTAQTNCSNKTGEITLTAGGGTPAYQYSIDGGATYVASNVFSNLPVGTYSGLKIKDANNCIRTNPLVNISLLDTMRLELGPDSTICIGQSVLMLTQTNAETDTFKWNRIRPLLDYDTAKTPIFSPIDTLNYSVVAKWGLCNRTDNITINVKRKPVPDAGRDTTVCYKTIAYLKGSASNLSGTVNYAWAPATLAVPNNTANAIAYPDTSRYFYLTVTDNYGCNFTVVDSVKITMRDQVNAFAGNDTIAMFNKPHQLEATGGVGFVWTPAAPLNNPFIRMPFAKLTHDQYFEVKVTDDIGCSAIDGVFIRALVGPTYYLPNAFSPNGDGLNELFTPIPSGIHTTDYFRIFDRYGTLMFQTQEWLKGWNGKFNNQPALAGTYVWIIKGVDVNGSIVEQKGTVILIR